MRRLISNGQRDRGVVNLNDSENSDIPNKIIKANTFLKYEEFTVLLAFKCYQEVFAHISTTTSPHMLWLGMWRGTKDMQLHTLPSRLSAAPLEYCDSWSQNPGS